MYSSHSDSLPRSAKKASNRKFFVASALTLSAILLFFSILVFKSRAAKSRPVQMPPQESVAELVSTTGMIFVGKPGSAAWYQAKAGAHLMEGDLVQTDCSGETSIRYSDGSTVSIQARTLYTVHNAGDGSMEIRVPSQEVNPPSLAFLAGRRASAQTATRYDKGSGAAAVGEAKAKESGLFIKLDRIVPFGRSLELIGRVEAGSRLAVNDEIVDVAGDGSFKHFTNPFPASARKVQLVMQVSDLIGRTRIVTTTHDFNPQDRGN